MNSRVINAGPGLMRKASMGGVVLTPFTRTRPVHSSPAAVTHPFKLSNASVGTTLKVRIKFGMVNGLTPGGMGDPAEPDLILTFSATVSKYVVLEVTTDVGGMATSAAISLQTTVPTDTATSGNQTLGLVTYTAAVGAVPASIAFSQVVAGSLAHMRCGGTTHLFGSV